VRTTIYRRGRTTVIVIVRASIIYILLCILYYKLAPHTSSNEPRRRVGINGIIILYRSINLLAGCIIIIILFRYPTLTVTSVICRPAAGTLLQHRGAHDLTMMIDGHRSVSQRASRVLLYTCYCYYTRRNYNNSNNNIQMPVASVTGI